MTQGLFISFEGPEGAGKTSVLKAVIEALTPTLNDRLVTTREPGGNFIAEEIRQLLLTKEEHGMDARTEALLYAAARRQHLVETILPALAQNRVVITDRYIDSSLAYQGGGRGLGVETVWQMNQFAMDGVLPALTIYLDVPVEIGLERLRQNRPDTANRLDNASLDFHRTVRATYLQLHEEHAQRIALIDATQPLEAVIEQTLTHIHNALTAHDAD